MNKITKEVILFALLFGVSLLVIFKSGVLAPSEGGWQIDNEACIGCGGCATECVLPKSAVVAVMNDDICTHQADCPAFFKGGKIKWGREYENCPTGAFIRTDNGDGTYNYSIDEAKCIGCGRCTKLCQRKGNGALTLIIDAEKCVDCNECQIGKQCPPNAIEREKE